MISFAMILSLIAASATGVSAQKELFLEPARPIKPVPIDPPKPECETFLWPKRNGKVFWAEVRVSSVYGTSDPEANAIQFCKEEGFSSVRSYEKDFECEHTGGEDNDESGYYSWNGGLWSYLPTPSSNRCYVMFKSIECCNDCETFNWPKRRGDLIWAEYRYSTVYGAADPDVNALQFCNEEGYASVGSTVGDTACEHTGGGDNDESGYSSWDVNLGMQRMLRFFAPTWCAPKSHHESFLFNHIQVIGNTLALPPPIVAM